ncbi:MAG: hypothetical protein WA485_25015 [Candidatus Sulfotelmatobacter sp.]
MGTSLAALGTVLTDGEVVLRGLNPKLADDKGLPTERCFKLVANDPIDDGPSFGIAKMPQGQEAAAPLGVRQGITPEDLLTVLPNRDWGVARLRVSEALEHTRAGVGFVHKIAEDWGEHQQAHCMITGHQPLPTEERNNLRRHLTNLALKDVPIPATLAQK